MIYKKVDRYKQFHRIFNSPYRLINCGTLGVKNHLNMNVVKLCTKLLSLVTQQMHEKELPHLSEGRSTLKGKTNKCLPQYPMLMS